MTFSGLTEIVNWAKSGSEIPVFDQPALESTLKNAINETTEGVKMVNEFKKHSERRPEQLHNILMEYKNKNQTMEF
jgi:hypothetical protein